MMGRGSTGPSDLRPRSFSKFISEEQPLGKLTSCMYELACQFAGSIGRQEFPSRKLLS